MPDLDLYPVATSVSGTDRLIIRQTDTLGAVHTRKIPVSLLPAGAGGASLTTLGVVTSIATADFVAIVQNGTAQLISVAALISGLSESVTQLNPGSGVNDTTVIEVNNGAVADVKQTGADFWSFVQGKLPGYKPTPLEISGTVTLDATLHNQRTLVATAATIINPPVLFANVGAGFSCEVINLSGAALTFGAGIVTSTGGSALAAGQTAKFDGLGGTLNYLFASILGGAGAPAVPGAPGVPVLGAVTSSSLAFTWTAPNTGGASSAYSFQYSPTGSGAWVTFGTSPSSAAITITGLSASTGYDVRVSALNAGGTGAYSPVRVNAVTAAGASTPTLTFTSFSSTLAGASNIATYAFANGAPTGLSATMDTAALTISNPTITTTSGSGATAAGTAAFTFTNPAAGVHSLIASGTGTYAATASAQSLTTSASATVTLTAPSGTINAGATFAITGAYTGTAPTGIGYAYDGAGSYTAATGFSASAGVWAATAVAPIAGTHSMTVQEAGTAVTSSASPPFTVSASGGTTLTLTALTPAAIGVVGSAQTFNFAYSAGTPGAGSLTFAVDGTAVTVSSITGSAGTGTFTIVGPALNSTNYAAHVGVATSGGSTATTTFLTRVVVAYNANSVAANINTGAQGGSGINPGNIYFGISGSDPVTTALYFGRSNDFSTYTAMPAYELGSPQQVLGFFSADQLTVPGNSLHIGGFGDWFNTMNNPNGTGHQFSGAPNAWAAGNYHLVLVTPDGGVFINAGVTTIS